MLRYRYFAPAIGWGIFIIVLSTMPSTSFPQFEWADLLSVDKLIHALFYGFLIHLTLWGCRKAFAMTAHNFQIMAFFAFIGAVAMGIALEVIQERYCVGRIMDIGDILGNTFGAIIAWFWAIFRTSKRLQNFQNNPESSAELP